MTPAGEPTPSEIDSALAKLDQPERRELAPGITLEFDFSKAPAAWLPKEKPAFIRCGNCGARMPRTFDIEKDHHTAMKHRVEECTKVTQAAREHAQLIGEFQQQLRLNPPPIAGRRQRRRWWKFLQFWK
jgi:ferredoxin